MTQPAETKDYPWGVETTRCMVEAVAHGITREGKYVPLLVDDEGRVIVSPQSPLPE